VIATVQPSTVDLDLHYTILGLPKQASRAPLSPLPPPFALVRASDTHRALCSVWARRHRQTLALSGLALLWLKVPLLGGGGSSAPLPRTDPTHFPGPVPARTPQRASRQSGKISYYEPPLPKARSRFPPLPTTATHTSAQYCHLIRTLLCVIRPTLTPSPSPASPTQSPSVYQESGTGSETILSVAPR